MPRMRLASAALVGATVAVSFSAIFIRIANDDPATIVWLRMAMATVLLAPFVWRDARHGSLPRSARDVLLVCASGVLLAGHFLLWTASLRYTSIAASVLLVSLHPIVVSPLAWLLLGERASTRALVGMVIAIGGTVITCAGDVQLSNTALFGDVLALGGALCLAGYLLIGRGVRGSLGVATYSATAYVVVAVVAAITATAGGVAHLPSARVASVCLALAIVCTLGGHTVYNWALRRVPALTVSVSFLGEAPLAALLALALLAAVPPLTTVIGGLIILTGVALVIVRASTPDISPV
jgi:drug/metabolite transporter (DMT)-like permease